MVANGGTRLAGTAQFYAWDGGCLFIGRDVGIIPVHAHHAIQVVFGSDGPVRLRGSTEEPWTAYGGAIVPSHQPHSLDATQAGVNAVLFVEPETREGRALNELYLASGIAAAPRERLAAPAAALFAAWSTDAREEVMIPAARTVVHALTGGVAPARVVDDRIVRAIAHIRDHCDAPLTLDEVSAVACLSPGRFRHLFVEETGMGLRPYILWVRFLRVWSAVQGGATLSEAAHAAGFADAAHLTRTSRRMFGIPPSALQVRRD